MRKLRELNPDTRKHFRKIVEKMVKTRQDFESLRQSSKESAESSKKIIKELRLANRSLQRSL
jgi:K+/H+ antiporter YhaU regulatory subunit KhtT